MSILEMIAEWRRGCSNCNAESIVKIEAGKDKEEKLCDFCVVTLVHAIEASEQKKLLQCKVAEKT